MLSGAMVIPDNFVANPIQVYAETLGQIDNADATVYDLSDIETQKGKIKININSNGKNILTGKNVQDDVRVDVQIVVEEGVVADLYLDQLDIENGADVEQHNYMNYPSTEGYSPLVINGVANVHIQSNSSMKSIDRWITVNGTMNIVESNKDATWKIELSEELKCEEEDFYIAKGYGSINMYSGNLSFRSGVHKESFLQPRFTIWNGHLTLDNEFDDHAVDDGHIHSQDITYEGGFISISEDYDTGKIKSNKDT